MKRPVSCSADLKFSSFILFSILVARTNSRSISREDQIESLVGREDQACDGGWSIQVLDYIRCVLTPRNSPACSLTFRVASLTQHITHRFMIKRRGPELVLSQGPSAKQSMKIRAAAMGTRTVRLVGRAWSACGWVRPFLSLSGRLANLSCK
jgi:hypothetical protein